MQKPLLRSAKRRFQQGGSAMPAFATYTPMLSPNVTAKGSTEVSTSSSSKDEEPLFDKKDISALLKDVLPSDAKVILSKAYSLMRLVDLNDTVDNPSVRNLISSGMLELQNITNLARDNYKNYYSAKDSLTQKGISGDIAQDPNGMLYYYDDNGNVRKCSLKDARGKALLSYDELSDYRSKSPNGAYIDDFVRTIRNAVSADEVMKTLNTIIDRIGNMKNSGDTYTEKRDNQVARGMEAVLRDARNGVYHVTNTAENVPVELKEMAISTILNMLPKNQLNYLNLHAHLNGVSTENLLFEMISSRDKISMSQKVSKDYDYDTEEEARRAAAAKAKSEGQTAEITPVRMINERLGQKRTIVLNDGNDHNFGYELNANVTGFEYKPDSKTGLMSVGELMHGDNNYSGVFDWNNASFAGTHLDANDTTSYILPATSQIIDIYLPYKTDQHGNIIPDLSMLSKMQKKDEVVNQVTGNGVVTPQNYQAVNQELRNQGVDVQVDETGRPVGQNYMRFAVIEAETGRKTFDRLKNPDSNFYKVMEDDALAKRIAMMTGVDADNDDIWPLSYFTQDEVITGSIYLPIIENSNNAMASSGSPNKVKDDLSVEKMLLQERNQGRAQYNRPDIQI